MNNEKFVDGYKVNFSSFMLIGPLYIIYYTSNEYLAVLLVLQLLCLWIWLKFFDFAIDLYRSSWVCCLCHIVAFLFMGIVPFFVNSFYRTIEFVNLAMIIGAVGFLLTKYVYFTEERLAKSGWIIKDSDNQ